MGDDLFAFGIRYNTDVQPGSTPLFNGNIAETHWITSENNIPRMYSYTYDGLNRLRNAGYRNLSNPVFTDALREALSYDKNGNITHLLRFGKIDLGTDSAGTLIDDLNYSYANQSNVLKKVVDLSNSTYGFKDDVTNGNDPEDDYTYDNYGNMTKDINKGITNEIKYNHLNLPLQINFANGGTIKYVYDATGVKQSKIVTANNTASTTKYLNGFQYNNDVLQFFPTAEGYVNHTFTNNQSYFNYVYNYTDHLGNIRLSYTLNEVTQEIQTLEEHHYYPLGLELINIENTAKKAFSKETTDITTTTGTTAKAPIITQVPNSGYQYQYNGKEWQDELGLNWYDMDMRQYDPTIARWIVQDPITHHNMSPYNAFDNNPVFWADPSGAYGEHYNWDNKRYEDDKGNEVSFETAMASVGLNTDGSKKDGKDDNITVNSEGIVTKVEINDKPNRFFDESGKELFFNDPNNDFSLINSWSEGDRLYYPISISQLIMAVSNAGLLPYVFRLHGKLECAWLTAGLMSTGRADFTFSYLVPNYFTQTEMSSLENGILRTQYNSYMHFFRFGDSKSIYNLYDAGNFMWGNWMYMNGFSYGSIQFGSQLNELGRDSKEDQRAIKNGYNFYNFK